LRKKIITGVGLLLFLLFLLPDNKAFSQGNDSLPIFPPDLDANLRSFRYQTAVAQVDSMLLRFPGDIALRRLKASINKNMGNLSQAKSLYESLVAEDSADIESSITLGTIYEDEMNYSKAIQLYRYLIQKDESVPYNYKLLGNAYRKAGIFSAALDNYQKAVSLNPNDLQTYKIMADIYLSLQRPTIADSVINIAYALDSNNIAVLLTSATCRFRLKKWEDAIVFLDKVSQSTDLTDYYLGLYAASLIETGAFQPAIQKLNRLSKEASETEIALYRYGLAHKGLKDNAKSREYFEKAIMATRSPYLSQYYTEIGHVDTEMAIYQKAAEAYQKAYEINKDPAMLYLIATSYDRAGKAKAALKYYRESLKNKDVLSPEIRSYVGTRIRSLGKKK